MSENFDMGDGNRLQQLISRFEEMLSDDRQFYFDADELEAIIDYYFERQDSKKAFEAIEAAGRLFPSASSFKIRAARLLAHEKEFYDALELLSEIELIEQANEEIFITKGDIYSMMNKHELAIEQYQRAVSLVEYPEDLLANIAYEYETLGDYRKAIRYLKQALEYNPDAENLLHELSFFYEINDQEEEGIAFLNSFLDEHPYSKAAWFNLGIFYNSLELYEKAIESYEFTLAIDETYTAAYFNMANSYAGLEHYEQAIHYYKETFRYEAPEAMTYYYIGESYENMGRLEQALHYFDKAARMDDGLAEAYAGMGRVYIRQGKDAVAIRHIEKAVSIMPFDDDIKYDLAIVYLRNSRFTEAEKLFGEIVEHDPYMIEAWINFSVSVSASQGLERAIDIIEQGLKANKDNAALWYRLAGYLYKSGKVQQAYYYIETALKLDYGLHEELLDFLPELNRESRFVELLNLYKHLG